MIFRAPSPETPYTLHAPHGRSIPGLTSVAAVNDGLDQLDAAARAVEDLPWVIPIHPTDFMDWPEEEALDAPTMMVGVGRDRVMVTWDHEEGGNAGSRSERPEDTEDATELTFRVLNDYSWGTPADLVPLAEARAAVTHWLTTGEQPMNIAWEEL